MVEVVRIVWILDIVWKKSIDILMEKNDVGVKESLPKESLSRKVVTL